MSASCERRRRGKNPASGLWVESLERINTISMSRVIIVSVLAFAVLVQTAHGNGTNSTTNQVHKSNESSASNGANQNGLVPVRWPQVNHTEQANTSQQQPKVKPSADQSKQTVAARELPASSSEAPSVRETGSTQTSKPANGTTSSPPQQARSGASSSLERERQSSDQRGQWTRGGSSVSSDLATSSSSLSSSLLEADASRQAQQQPKKSSAGAQANRWTHFGARLRPLTSVSQQQQADHYHGAASSSKANMAERSVRAQANPAPARNQLAPLSANSVEAPTSSEEDNDEDDLDSEAILYKLMQQSNFLMNPNFQDQPQRQQRAGLMNSPPLGHNQQQLKPTANNQQQVNNDEELAKSKRVIKLLKSYSHIHQVDDSDDQIRGAYTRYAKPSQAAPMRQRRPIGNRQHIFISSVPVATSQTRATARVYANNDDEDDGQYRTPRAQAGLRSDDGGEGSAAAAAAESGNGSNANGPEQEEEDFECPNNGIFADVASGCQAYHVCQSASQVQQRFQCPLGTLFNDIILTCDFAHNVQCGKKAGELSGASFPSPSVNQQPPEQPQQATRHRAQAPVGDNSNQRQRPVSNGPRHLVIGSPYNLHNAQQRPAQSQPPALSSYPPVKPLSNEIAPNNNNNNGDEEDDNEADEPLVPATLPPRPSSSPPPNFQSAHSTQVTTPTNFGPAPQEQAIRPQQPVYRSTYQQQRQQAPSRSPSPRQQQQQQRPRYQPDLETGNTPASNFGASAAPPTFVEPNQQRQKSFSQHDSSTVQTPTGGQANDLQSFSLVINHMAPAVLPKQPTATAGNNYSQQQTRQQHQQEPTQRVAAAAQRSSVQSQRVATAAVQLRGSQQVSQAANTNPRAQWVEAAAPLSSAQQAIQPQRHPNQRSASRRHLHSATLPSSQHFTTEPVATSTFGATSQASRYGQPTTPMTSQVQPQRLASGATITTPATYEEATPAASQPSVSHQHDQQPLQASFAGNKIDNSEAAAADLAAQELAIRQQQPRFPQDSSAPNEDVLNDGMFLIIRHSSRAPPIQVVGANQAAAAAGTAPAPTTAVDLNAVQKFGAVERHRAVAPSRGVPAKQRTQQVYGLLPPMEPPAPEAHDDQHKQRQQQYNANSDQLVPLASSNPAANDAEATAKQQPSSTSTPPSSSSSPTQPTEVRAKGQKRQITPNKSTQKQQPRAIRVAKRVKSAATPSKALHNQTNSTTSVANKTISSNVATNVAPTSL